MWMSHLKMRYYSWKIAHQHIPNTPHRWQCNIAIFLVTLWWLWNRHTIPQTPPCKLLSSSSSLSFLLFSYLLCLSCQRQLLSSSCEYHHKGIWESGSIVLLILISELDWRKRPASRCSRLTPKESFPRTQCLKGSYLITILGKLFWNGQVWWMWWEGEAKGHQCWHCLMVGVQPATGMQHQHFPWSFAQCRISHRKCTRMRQKMLLTGVAWVAIPQSRCSLSIRRL